MAEQIIDTLVTVITADTSDFGKKAEQVRELFRRLKYSAEDYAEKQKASFEKVNKSMNTTTQVLSRFAKRFIGVYAIISTGKQVMNQALAFDRLSRSLNMNVEDVQAWGNILKQEGGSLESFSASAKKLSNQLNAIPLQGNSPLLVNLNRLGINAYSAGGGIKSVNSILFELSDRLKGMSGAQAMSIGKMLGLDDAMVRTLQKGRRELNALLIKNKEVGIYNEQMVNGVVKLNQKWQELKQSFLVIAGSLLEKMLPALQWGIDLLTLITSVVQDVINNFQDFASACGVVGGAIVALKLAMFLGHLTTAFGRLRMLVMMTKAWAAVQGVLNAVMSANPLVWIIALIGVLIGAFYLLFNDIRTWLNGGESMFGGFYDAIASGWHWIEGLWRKGMDWLSSKLDWLVDKAKKVFNFLKNPVGGIIDMGLDLMGYSRPVGNSSSISDSHNVTTNNISPVVNVSGVQDPQGFGQSMMTGMTQNLNFGGQP